MSSGEPKKTNWLLWLLVIGAALVFTPLACCGGLGILGFNAAKAPLLAAGKALEADERVVEKIGTPISYDNLIIKNFNMVNGEGSAELDTDYSGPNGTVHVEGEMALSANEWSPGDLTVTFDDGSEIKIPE